MAPSKKILPENPVMNLIEEGHYEKSVPPGKQVCRKDGQEWPCLLIKGARKAHRINYEMWQAS